MAFQITKVLSRNVDTTIQAHFRSEVSCYTFEKCQLVPSSVHAELPTQLAYVIKKKDFESQRKLKLSQKQENILQMQKDQENYLNWKFSHHEPKLPSKLKDKSSSSLNTKYKKPKLLKVSKEILVTDVQTKQNSDQDPNVPEILTKNCVHNTIMKNHALDGGQRAGIYTFRGFTPGFKACLNLCCADQFCDAAFMVGKRCYSVQCYKNGKCSSKMSKSKHLQSMLAFIERQNTADISESKYVLILKR